MKEYVDVQVLKQQDFQDYSKTDVQYAIDHCPRADVVPRKYAEWVFVPPYYPYESDKYRCSCCKSEIRADEKYKMKFCFSCGARMKGE